jgi:hypothetical protein
VSHETYRRWNCGVCGVNFTKPPRGKPYKFCSRACGVVGRSGPTRKSQVTVQCEFCRKGYSIRQSHALFTKYCSKACMTAGRDIKGTSNPNFKNAGVRKCEACGGEYRSYNSSRRYCGIECSWISSASEAMKNYRRGYSAELACRSLLAKHGFVALRSPASKGMFDVIAIGDGGTYLIQVKRTKTEARKKFTSLVKQLSETKFRPPHHIQVWVWIDRKGWYITHVIPGGEPESFWMLDEMDYQRVCGVTGFKEEVAESIRQDFFGHIEDEESKSVAVEEI